MSLNGAGATGNSTLPKANTTPRNNLWIDMEKDGSGLKQKLRDLKRQVETEVVSARREVTIKKNQTHEVEDNSKMIEEAKKDIIGMMDGKFDDLSKFYPMQKNEDARLQTQITQLNQENVGLAQSLIALDRRIRSLEEDLHGAANI